MTSRFMISCNRHSCNLFFSLLLITRMHINRAYMTSQPETRLDLEYIHLILVRNKFEIRLLLLDDIDSPIDLGQLQSSSYH